MEYITLKKLESSAYTLNIVEELYLIDSETVVFVDMSDLLKNDACVILACSTKVSDAIMIKLVEKFVSPALLECNNGPICVVVSSLSDFTGLDTYRKVVS